MQNQQVLRIGFFTYTNWAPLLNSQEKIRTFLSRKICTYCQIALTLADYLVIHKKAFDKVNFTVASVPINLTKYLNESKLDIVPQFFHINEAEKTDFAYPFQLFPDKFMIRKPEYKPHVFGIFETFSLSIWIAIIISSVSLMLIYYITLRWKFSLDKILLHIIAVLLRQSLIFKPSTVAENLLVYSWVVGGKLLCLANDSVFLSFLAIPPVVKINTVAQLARAVENGDYRCVCRPGFDFERFLESNIENFRIIGIDLKRIT